MPLHDYACKDGHVTTSLTPIATCGCGKPVRKTFAFWKTIHGASPRSMERYSRGYYDTQLKEHITSKKQREQSMKEKGYVERRDFTADSFRKQEPGEDTRKAEKRHEAASRAAHARPDRENRARWREDIRKGKFA